MIFAEKYSSSDTNLLFIGIELKHTQFYSPNSVIYVYNLNILCAGVITVKVSHSLVKFVDLHLQTPLNYRGMGNAILVRKYDLLLSELYFILWAWSINLKLICFT